jgi:predicted DNA-binding transcriptional regulator AlpA
VRFIRTRQVLEKVGVGRTMLWKMTQEGSFPRPARITERNSGYLLEAVEEWMQLRTQGVPWQPKGRGRASAHGAPRRGAAKLVLARQAGAPQESAR